MTESLDRAQRMSLFPLDDHLSIPTESRPSPELADIARDSSASLLERDDAIWNLVYRRQRQSKGLLLQLATGDRDPRIRRSAAWGLLRLDAPSELAECVADDDQNTHYWKRHLLFEARGSSEAFDDRPIRVLRSREFDITIP